MHNLSLISEEMTIFERKKKHRQNAIVQSLVIHVHIIIPTEFTLSQDKNKLIHGTYLKLFITKFSGDIVQMKSPFKSV